MTETLLQHGKDIITSAVAIAAFVVSLVSLRNSSRALTLAEAQERRREPRLSPKLVESGVVTSPSGDRRFSFLFSIANPSDSDNAIARVEMHVRYFLDPTTPIIVKLPISTGIESPDRQQLKVPVRVAAHDTVSGWCEFVIAHALLKRQRIDGYKISFIDSQERETAVEAHIMNEKINVA